MTKTRNRARRILSLMLSLAMMLTLLVPAMAWAAGSDPTQSYTISIYPNTNTLHPADDKNDPEEGEDASDLAKRFTAYAIFEGKLNDAATGGYDNGGDDQPNKVPTQNQLADVVWGKGIKTSAYSDLLVALCKSDVKLTDLGIILGNVDKLKEKYDDPAEIENAFKINVSNTDTVTTLGDLFKRALEMNDYVVDIIGNNGVTVKSGSKNTDSALNGTAAIIARVISDINEAHDTEIDGGTSTHSNNSTLANEFAKIVAKSTTTGVEKTYTYLSTTVGDSTTSTWAKQVTAVKEEEIEVVTPAHWTITGLNSAGYYLIIDNYNTKGGTAGAYDPEQQDEVSEYMVAVFGDQEIYIKSESATVEKDIVLSNGTTVKGTSGEILDTVTFRLKGTLPENYEDKDYETFEYMFHDKMSKGLTLDAGSIKVYAVDPGARDDDDTDDVWYQFILDTGNSTGTAVDSFETAQGDGYFLTTNSSENVFNVNFKDLKSAKATKVRPEQATTPAAVPGIEANWTIVVEYTATINENAVVTDPKAEGETFGERNWNSVYLEYSNDVNDESSTGKTTEKTVYVYIYGEDIVKEDGTKTENAALPGVGFALKKTVAANTIDSAQANTKLTAGDYYAVFTRKETVTEAKEGNGWLQTTTYEYTLAGWVSATVVDGLSDFPADAKTWKDAVSGNFLNEKITAGNRTVAFDASGDAKYYLAFTTVDTDVTTPDGTVSETNPKTTEKLLIKGLDEDIAYTLVEKYTLPGYDTMKDVTFTIDATVNTTTGNLEAMKVTHDDRDDVTYIEDATTKQIATGYIDVTLDNMPSGYLPGTGGLGTTLFYTGGAVMLALGVLHIFRRRRLAN